MLISDIPWGKFSKRRNETLHRYEPVQPYFLRELASRVGASCFIDVGANVGAYSLLMAHVSGIDQVIAIEANPKTFELLLENARLVDLPVETFNLAASDRSGVVKLGVVSEYSGANSIVETSIHRVDNFAEVIDVNSERLDNIASLSGKTAIIKVDVEGHEIAVLSGAERILTSNSCIVQVESYGQDALLATFFENIGYKKFFTIGPDVFYGVQPIEQLRETSYLAIQAALVETIKECKHYARMHARDRKRWREGRAIAFESYFG